MRCRLILLISEHPMQQGIRKGGGPDFCDRRGEDEDEELRILVVGLLLLHPLRQCLVMNYDYGQKCLFSSYSIQFQEHKGFMMFSQKNNLMTAL